MTTEGYDVDERRDGNRETPLHGAGARGRVEIARWLLDHGATIDAEDKWGRTPLFFAATCGSLPTVELLLAHGADPRKRGGDPSRSPAEVARERGKIEVADFLERFVSAGGDWSVRG